MAKKILAVLAALILGFVAFVATRPAQFVISRKVAVAAGPEIAFSLVNDFHQWKAWSPWEKLDPKMTTTFEGPASGPGASYGWKGNDQVGEGRMTILQSKPDQQLTIKLEFLKPFEATNTTTFLFAAAPPGTEVTWKLEGKNNFLAKAASVFMNMDAMIGKDFELGLANLKALAEAAPRQPAAPAPAPAEPMAAPADAGP